MNCPKCIGKLQKKFVEGVEVDVCFVCEGIWFDKGEMDEILKRDSKAFESHDAGFDEFDGKEVGDLIKEFDAKVGKCPRCEDGTAMIRKEFQGKHKIVADVCLKGHGIWLDGGEVKDLRRRGLVELKKRMDFIWLLLRRAFSIEGVKDLKRVKGAQQNG